MADIKYIKDLFKKKGLSLREIARVTGYNFRAVRKYIDKEDWSQPLANRTRSICDEWGFIPFEREGLQLLF